MFVFQQFNYGLPADAEIHAQIPFGNSSLSIQVQATILGTQSDIAVIFKERIKFLRVVRSTGESACADYWIAEVCRSIHM